VFTQKTNLKVKNEEKHIRVELTDNQRGKIKDVMARYRVEKSAKTIGAAARRDAEMYRIVHDDSFADNSKAGEIVRLMKESHDGEKAVIHVQGIKALESTKARLESEFGAGTVVMIKGQDEGSSKAEIDRAKKAFNDKSSPVRFIIGTKSMEEGHNLTNGTVNFHLDQPDSHASVDQRNKRTYRRGQDKDVTSYTMSGNNPWDIRKEAIIRRKKRESSILGNPQEIEGMDGTGFLSYLNKAEQGED